MIRISNRAAVLLGVVVVAAAIAVGAGIIFGDWGAGDHETMARRRPIIRPSTLPPPRAKPIANATPIEERDVKDDVVEDVALVEAPKVEEPPPVKETIELGDLTEIRIELPVSLTVAGRPLAGGLPVNVNEVNGDPVSGLPPMLYDLLERSGWEDPGFQLKLEGAGTLYFPANNRLSQIEVVLTPRSVGARNWKVVSEWAHGLQELGTDSLGRWNKMTPIVGVDESPLRVAPTLRSSEHREDLRAKMAELAVIERISDGSTDPPPARPVASTSTTNTTWPVAVAEVKVETRRAPERVKAMIGEVSSEAQGNEASVEAKVLPEESAPESPLPETPLPRRMLIKLAHHVMEITKLDAPGMAVGYGNLVHAALDGPLPMVAPKVMGTDRVGGESSIQRNSPPQRSNFVQYDDRFFWFVWDDVRRTHTLLPTQLENDVEWKLWTLAPELTAGTEFLAASLGRPKLLDFGLDFGDATIAGTLIVVAPLRSPAPMPVDLEVEPHGIEIDLFLHGPRREPPLPRPRDLRERHRETPFEAFLRKNWSWTIPPIHMKTWEYSIFVPGNPLRVQATANWPKTNGISWSKEYVDVVKDGITRVEPKQTWQSLIVVRAVKNGVVVNGSTYHTVVTRTQGLPTNPRPLPANAPPPRHYWRLNSYLYGEKFPYRTAPSVLDWDIMYGRGFVWDGNHQTNVAELNRRDFLVHARLLHRQLEVPQAIADLFWREGGPRLEESELVNVGKEMPRFPHAFPPEIPIDLAEKEPFEAALRLSKLSIVHELPRVIEERREGGIYPDGTRSCLAEGAWVGAAHRDHGFGVVFIPKGHVTDVEIELVPWSAIGWQWMHIPRGHWPDGTAATYNPKSSLPEPPPPPAPITTPSRPGRQPPPPPPPSAR